MSYEISSEIEQESEREKESLMEILRRYFGIYKYLCVHDEFISFSLLANGSCFD